jgi:uncharacterized tellurite resistance protein B-like protein
MADLSRRRDVEEFADDDYRLAVAALMAHVADADGVTTPAERLRLQSVLSSAFDLDADATRRLVEAGRRSDREAVDFHGFASVLKRSLDADGRLRIVEMLWEVAYADGQVHEFEGDIVARVAELLDVPETDVATVRRVAAGKGTS